jgi:protein Tex
VDDKLLEIIGSETEYKPFQIQNTIELHQSDATVPFIARYRKEKTGNLDETAIRSIIDRFEYLQELGKRKETVLTTIDEQGKLTDELKQKIDGCYDRQALEDIYLPYKPKRRTRATIAREKGLEPLAKIIIEQTIESGTPEEYATQYINEEKGVASVEEALKGASDILAEEVAETAEYRTIVREFIGRTGAVASKVKKDFAEEETKFKQYYDFAENIRTIPSHRLLAIRRGEIQKVLAYSLDYDTDQIIERICAKVITNNNSIFQQLLENMVGDSLGRLMRPSIETEIKVALKESADEEAIKVFSKNLRNLLLAAPAGQRVTMGIDPGFRSGCKVVVVDATGKFLEYQAIFPHPPQKRADAAAAIVSNLIKDYNVELIAIGNGTASRETDRFVANLLSDIPEPRPNKVIVSEAGASVYSASQAAIDEFPDLDITVRGAISIARRLMDPLADLVKIDPKSIGVGQYQHDVNQTLLKKSLEGVVVSCVNLVGVELNTASYELLCHVSGLNKTLAKNIIAHRAKNGAFDDRKKLLKVPRFGDKAFEQAAGFLRIKDGPNPLDASSVHPESYYIVEKIAATTGTDIGQIIGSDSLIGSLQAADFTDDKAGLPTVMDIFDELKKPGRDPRAEFVTAKLDDAINEMEDLNEGMILEGTVTNVTNFGAFVDVGVHQDGLVHISELADRFVKNPHDEVTVGQITKVKVISIDLNLKRIALSRKQALSS